MKVRRRNHEEMKHSHISEQLTVILWFRFFSTHGSIAATIRFRGHVLSFQENGLA